jgi:site-specific DNA recombinase
MPSKQPAIYARYSSHAQDDSSSVEIQIQHCERTLGGPAQHYIDSAKTGRSVAGRDALANLRADCKAGLISRVCVWRFSRIGRNLAESAMVIQELEDCDVQVVSAMEGSDPLVRSIFLGMAEHYSKELASNTRDGLAATFMKRGITGGVTPFGYQIVTDNGIRKLAVNPSEADTIRELVTTYLGENIGLKGLSRRMTERGIPSRKGARWTHTTIRSTLRNPILIGQMRFLRRQMKINRTSGRRVPKFRAEADTLTYQDESLRILTDEQFAKVQALAASRSPTDSTTPRLPREVRAFTGLAFCAECGTACYTCKSQNSKGTYHYLACGTRCRHGKDGCPTAGRVREDQVLEIIKSDYAAIFDDQDDLISSVIGRTKELSKSQQSDVARVKAELAELDKQTKPLLALLTNPDVHPSAISAVSRQIGELEVRRQQMNTAMGRLAQEAGETTEKLADAVRMALEEAKRCLASVSSPAEFNRFVARFVGPFVVAGDGSVKAKSPVGAVTHPTGDIAGGGFEPPTSGL